MKAELPYEKEAQQFHQDNPNVYKILTRLARQALGQGKRCGIRMLWEVMRWEMFLATTDKNSKFKLNDHYTSWYARYIMANEPDLQGFFNLRKQASQPDSGGDTVDDWIRSL